MQMKPGEDIHSLGVRMEEKCMEIHNQIKIKFLKIKKDSNKTTFDSEDAFMLMASMLMVQHVQTKEPEAYKHMVRDIDNDTKPTEISLRARSYIDKIGPNEPAAVSSGTFQTNHNPKPPNPKSQKKDKDCFYWKRNGRCNRKDKCPFLHQAKFKKEKPANNEKKAYVAQGGNKSDGSKPAQTPNSTPPAQPQAYPGAMPYYFMPPHPYMHQNQPEAGNSFIVGNSKQLYDDDNYESYGQEVFQRD